MQHLHSNDDFKFSEEYGSVEPDQNPTSYASMQPDNLTRNRYANIKAYDHSRVLINGSDYINANRIAVSITISSQSTLNDDQYIDLIGL